MLAARSWLPDPDNDVLLPIIIHALVRGLTLESFSLITFLIFLPSIYGYVCVCVCVCVGWLVGGWVGEWWWWWWWGLGGGRGDGVREWLGAA